MFVRFSDVIRNLRLALAVTLFLCRPAWLQGQPKTAGGFEDSTAIKGVLSGRSDTANAAWWGFDRVDATHAIQGAINSGAKTVIVPNMMLDWVVRPIVLASDQRIILEPGVVITAKEGWFRGLQDALFVGREVQNVMIHGAGATARMRKSDYVSGDYERSEWRHVLALYGASNIEVHGLTMKSSGGDGIYIGPTWDDRRVPCRRIRVVGCVCDDNHRQGISVVSAEDVLIEKCSLRNTRGTSPQAGIDVEPAHPRDLAVGIEVRDCIAESNAGSGFLASLSRLNRRSQPASIRFVNGIVRDSRSPGLRAVIHSDSDPRGIVEFINCHVERTAYAGAAVIWNTWAEAKLRFQDCTWRNVALRDNEPPIYIELRQGSPSTGGGIAFENCYIYDSEQRSPVRFVSPGGNQASRLVAGLIHVINPELTSDKVSEGKLPDLAIDHKPAD